jgi:hypothetical protein
VTDKDLKRYDILLRTHVEVKWTNEDVKTLLDEVLRLRERVSTEDRPVALRDHWAQRTRFVGGH